MEYTVKELCALAGITPRTLRYYDGIHLLTPQRKASDYRIYGQAEVDRLQQILFYRELGIPLRDIKEILDAPEYNAPGALRKHLEKVRIEQKRMDTLARNLEKTIKALEGDEKMTDMEKFDGFKQSLVDENEKQYGREIREKYGDDAVEGANRKLMGMDEATYKRAKDLEEKIKEKLCVAMQTGDSTGDAAMETAGMHRDWICMYWETYSAEAYANLARMYADDERFTAYYDKIAPGAAEFLRDAILAYLNQRS